MRIVSLVACATACWALAACAKSGNETMAHRLSPELAAEIEGICGLPAGALTKQVPVSDAMPKIACAVQEARKRNVAIGFISNPAAPDT